MLDSHTKSKVVQLEAAVNTGKIPSFTATVHASQRRPYTTFIGFETENRAVFAMNLPCDRPACPDTYVKTGLELRDDHILLLETNWDLRSLQGLWNNCWRYALSHDSTYKPYQLLEVFVGGMDHFLSGTIEDYAKFHKTILRDRYGYFAKLANVLDSHLRAINNPYLAKIVAKVPELW